MRISAQVKRIRGKLNVPRERFWINDAGDYRIPQFVRERASWYSG
jgi:hypothetical protein